MSKKVLDTELGADGTSSNAEMVRVIKQEAETEMKKHGLVVNRMPAVDGRALSREELLQESTKIAAYLQPRGNTHSLLTHSLTHW